MGGEADKGAMSEALGSAVAPGRARCIPWLGRLGRHAVRIVVVLLLGGLLGATLARFAPGFGVNEQDLDSRLSAASQQALRQQSAAAEGLPAYYVHAWGRLLRGDLGESQVLHEPVRQLLAERFPETLKSVALGLALGWAAGLALAVAAVMARGGVTGLLATALASVFLCIPAAVLALLFVLAQMPGRLVIALIVFPKIYQYAHSLLAAVAGRPHILAARAQGAGPVRILLLHILLVAAPQLLALAGISVSLALAAAIPVEALCDLPGIGQLAWQAAMSRDLPLLLNLTLLVTLVTLLANAAADLAGVERA